MLGPATRLDQHQRRRSAGLPTVTVLLGDPPRPLAPVRHWCEHRGLPLVECHGASLRPWFVAVLTSLDSLFARRRPDIEPDLDPHTFDPDTFDPHAFDPGTFDLDTFDLDTFGSETDRRIADRLHSDLAGHDGLDAECEVDALLALAGEESPAALARVAITMYNAVAGDAAVPVAVLVPADGENDAGWPLPAIAGAIRIAEAAPALPLHVLCTHDDWRRLAKHETHNVALLRDGVIKLDHADAAAPPTASADEAHDDRLAVARAQARDAWADVQGAFARVDRADRAALDNAVDRARSAAERLLFEALEAHPPTHGRFALNQPGGFRFGAREVEIDLLDRDARLAVEVDGYFHFRSNDDFRRDRRKDLLLQRHGYWIARFLAGDVIERLDHVVTAITDAIAARDAARTSDRDTPHASSHAQEHEHA